VIKLYTGEKVLKQEENGLIDQNGLASEGDLANYVTHLP